MDPLLISPTEESPGIHLDAQAGRFELWGKSYPEDAVTVFEPVFKWFKQYIESPNERTVIAFRLEYFNTASQKLLLDLLLLVDKLAATGKEVMVEWYYEEEDESMLGTGEEFADLLDVPFSILETTLDE